MHDADARQHIERLVAFDHRDLDAGAPELDGRQHSGRPIADDHDIVHCKMLRAVPNPILLAGGSRISQSPYAWVREYSA